MKKILELFILIISFNSVSLNAQILADYEFDNNLSSSIKNAPDLIYLGNKLTFHTQNLLGQSNSSARFDLETGFQLPLNQWDIGVDYSLLLVVRVDAVNRYKKLIDFANLNEDSGLYSYYGAITFYPLSLSTPITVIEDQYFQLIFTRSDSHHVKIYHNGVLLQQFDDSTNQYTNINGTNNLYFLIDDLNSFQESPSGFITQLSIYNHEISQSEIENLNDIIFANGFETL